MEITVDLDAINNISKLVSQVETGSLNVTDFQTSLTINTSNYTSIAKGSFGSAFLIPGTDIVVKEATPCAYKYIQSETPPSLVETSMCTYLDERDSGIIKMKSTNNKNLILAPNLLAEGLIGAELNKLLNDGVSEHFVRTYGVMYDPVTKSSYTFIEKLEGNIHREIITPVDMYTMLFQIAQGLASAQDKLKFTHYDLHGGNLLWERSNVTDEPFIYYSILDSNGNTMPIKIENRGFKVKIIDFGLSRLETNTSIINNKIDWYKNAVAHHSVYDPYYDMLTLIGYLSVSNSKLHRKYISLLSIDDMIELLVLVTGVNPPSKDFTKRQKLGWYKDETKYMFRRVNRRTIWRPKEYSSTNKYIQGSNIHKIIGWLAFKLNDLHSLTLHHVQVPDMIVPSLYNRISTNTNTNTVTRHIIDDGIIVTGSATYNMLVHTVFINTNIAGNKKYRFTSDCCKINQLQQLETEYGFSITAGATDVKGDWGQINGIYENSTYKSGESTTVKNIIKIDKSGRGLGIVPSHYVYNDNSDKSIFSVGPIFITNGLNVMPRGYSNSSKYVTILSYRSNNRKLAPEYNLLVTIVENTSTTSKLSYSDIYDVLNSLESDYSILMYQGEMGQLSWRSKNEPDNIYVASNILPVEVPAPISFSLFRQ